MKYPRALLLAPAAVALGLACTQPMCGCPPARSHVMVEGTVTTAAGAPVQGAAMHATLFPQRCDSPFGETSHVATDAAGRYEVRAFSVHGGAACLRVTAVRGAGAQADSVWEDGFAVPLVHEDDEPRHVVVDLVFP
jgi:hypothetical protein